MCNRKADTVRETQVLGEKGGGALLKFGRGWLIYDFVGSGRSGWCRSFAGCSIRFVTDKTLLLSESGKGHGPILERLNRQFSSGFSTDKHSEK